jgi:hypothetical protein
MATLSDVDKAMISRLKRLTARIDTVTAERDQAMLDARAAGASLRDIAKATGLSAPGVLKILNRLTAPHKPE